MISRPFFSCFFDDANLLISVASPSKLRGNFQIDFKLQKELAQTKLFMSSVSHPDLQNQSKLNQVLASSPQNKMKPNVLQSLNKEKKFLPSGFHIVHVQSTLNNTILSLTSLQGEVLSWSSAGSAGFKNARKSTSYAAQAAAEKLSKYCLSQNIKKVHVKLKGLGYGKEACLKGLQMNGLLIQKIEDVTSIAHNGCRLPKKRRM